MQHELLLSPAKNSKQRHRHIQFCPPVTHLRVGFSNWRTSIVNFWFSNYTLSQEGDTIAYSCLCGCLHQKLNDFKDSFTDTLSKKFAINPSSVGDSTTSQAWHSHVLFSESEELYCWKMNSPLLAQYGVTEVLHNNRFYWFLLRY